MEYIYKCYETKLISLSIYYYNNYLLNDENKENYIYHLNRLINKVDYNAETYINKDYGYIINSLGEQRKDCVLHISLLMDIDYDYNDIIIYYLNNKFTDIDKNIKANYETLHP